MELHIITGCVVLLTLKVVGSDEWVKFKNWLYEKELAAIHKLKESK